MSAMPARQPAGVVVQTPPLGSRALYEVAYWTSMAGFILGYGMRAEGGHNIPSTGPALLISNHQSFLDPVIIGLAIRRPLRYLARKPLFNHPQFAWLIRQLNAVPIDQDGVGKEGIRTILAQLQAGDAVVVFPEGERCPKGSMLPLKPGIQLLIQRTKCPIVPVGIAGAYNAWPRWQKLPKIAPLFLPHMPGRLAVCAGPPLDAAYFAGLPRQQSLAELFDAIYQVQQTAERLRRDW